MENIEEYQKIEFVKLMEIIIDVPQYEGNNKISVIKYNKGNIDGKLDVKATVEP